MKISIWQFAALLALLVAGYLIYAIWWSDQDQVGWIRNMRKIFFASEEEIKEEAAPAEEPDPASSWIK